LLIAAFRDDSEVHYALPLWIVVKTSVSVTLIGPLLAQTRAEDGGIPPSCLLVDLSRLGRGICNDLGKLFLKLSLSFLSWTKMFLGG